MSRAVGPVSFDYGLFRGTYTSLARDCSTSHKWLSKEVNGYRRFHLTVFTHEE
jgi:hypothetical protein